MGTVLLLLVNMVWLILVPFGLPGNWLMVITTALFAWWQRANNVFSPWTLAAMGLLAVTGEVVEFLAAAGGAKKAGAGTSASAAAILGAIVGAVFGTFFIPVPVVGTILGGGIGAGLAAWAVEIARGRKAEQAAQAGVGAGLGRLAGSAAKVAIGVAIWATAAVAAFWP